MIDHLDKRVLILINHSIQQYQLTIITIHKLSQTNRPKTISHKQINQSPIKIIKTFRYNIYPSIMTKQIAIKVGMGVGAIIAGVLAKSYIFPPKPKTTSSTQSIDHQFKATCSLLGDVGGTNIRLELVIIKPPSNTPERTIKRADYLVAEEADFGECLRKFLSDVDVYPEVAAIAMAGPVKNNKLSMANVRKWGVIDGDKLSQQLNIPTFKLMNDFEANSFGLLLVPDQDFISLNGYQMNKQQTLGIMGPGTGLGNSILYTSPFRHRKRVYWLGSQGGHTDIPYIDDEVVEYVKFFQKNLNIPDITYISLERSFCGPAIPMMYRFFEEKFPEAKRLDKEVVESPAASKQIINNCLEENPSVIFANVFRLFMKIYEAAIGNYLAQHMCIGGLVLVGSLTNGILPKISKMKLLDEWKKRHVEFASNIEDVPLIVCKEVDLGLKGAFVMARRIIADSQHE